MKFRILGPLEVESDGRLLPLGSRHPRTLLAVLLLNANRVVSRDRLVDAIWGDDPPERATNALQVYVSQLRKELGRESIVTQQPGYRIDVGDGELDLDRFCELVAEARSADASDAVGLLRSALRLWRDAPLADLDDVPSLDGERRRLEELRMSTIEQRIQAELELGEHAGLVPELELLVRDNPLRERPRAQLMLALYRSGRQAEALEVYRQGRRELADELGLEPGEELKQLERAILAQDPNLGPLREPPSATRAKQDVPTGTVTFLFTDVEGSPRLMDVLGDRYGELLGRQQQLVRDAVVEHGGLEVANQADAFFFAFRRARDAVAAAIAAQRAIQAAPWPENEDVRIRIGIHTGEPGVAEGSYHGLDVVRAARVSGAAHGGQILVSSATRDLVGASVPEASFRDLGEHGLPEIGHPQRIFQVLAPGLFDAFPPLETRDVARVMPIRGREAELAAAAEAAVGAQVRRIRLFRRSRVAAAAGAVLVAGAAAAIALSLTHSGAAPVIVRPNSVAVVDPHSGRLVADVQVGSRPVAVATGAGGVWVANGDDGTVMRIDPETRRVTATIGIGTDISDIAVGFDSVWVAGGNDSTLTRIDPTADPPGIEATLHFGTGTLAPEPIFSVATGPEGVWLTRGSELVLVDPRSDRPVHSYPIPSPVAIATGGGAIWVTTQDERLLRYSAAGGRIGSLSLPSEAVPKYGAGALWILVFLGTGAVWQVDPSSMVLNATSTITGEPNELAVGEGGVWAAGSGLLTRIDPASGKVSQTIKLGLEPTAVAAGEGRVWVAVQRAS